VPTIVAAATLMVGTALDIGAQVETAIRRLCPPYIDRE
jgi:hypothetical protein